MVLMNQKPLLVIGILIVIAVLGFYYFKSTRNLSTQPSPAAVATQNPTPTAEPKKEILVSLSELNDSSESGTARLMEENGKVKVTLELTGALAKSDQPAHIHTGKCPGIGDIKYPLENVLEGKSETLLETTIDKIISELPLAINVHKSKTQIKTYVSCGDIQSP